MQYTCSSRSFHIYIYIYICVGFVMDDGVVDLPITFRASKPGHYPCTVVLQAQDDIRVYKIECTVTPHGGEAYFEFTSPVHQLITQDIPIVSATF